MSERDMLGGQHEREKKQHTTKAQAAAGTKLALLRHLSHWPMLQRTHNTYLDTPMETCAIVGARGAEREKVLGCARYFLACHLDLDVSQSCMQCDRHC
jgi:hypothetical protein